MDEVQRKAVAQWLVTKAVPMAPSRDPALDALWAMADAGTSHIGILWEPQPAPAEICEQTFPLARIIDHTALKPAATEGTIRTLCKEAIRFGFASVCVPPCYVPLASERLKGTAVAVCTVAGFPLGSSQHQIKAAESRQAVRDGAREVDMVLNVGLLKSGRLFDVERDIRAVVTACKAERARVVVKVIVECCLLSDEEKVIACVLARHAGADFVKTSTGFAGGGASVEDVGLMARVVGKRMGIKAAGGIRTRKQALALVAHGATRIGASASVAFLGD